MKKFKLIEQIYFSERMSYLLSAGMSLSESLSLISRHSGFKQKQKYLKIITEYVQSGNTLSTSIASCGVSFSPLAQALILVGEKTGTLQENFKYISQELGKRQTLKQKIISALIYPVCILCITFLLCIFLIVYIFPKIRPLFSSLKVPLPWTTRSLIFLSFEFQKFGLYFLILLGSCVGIFLFIYSRKQEFRIYFLKFLHHIFFLNTLLCLYWNILMMRYLHILLKGSLVLDEACVCITSLITHELYKEASQKVTEKISHGKKISEALTEFPELFPPFTIEMLSIGETSGSLAETAGYVADIFSQELENKLKTLTGLLEPMLMIGMGFIVGFIALSIITPLYAITQNIHK